MKHPLIVLAVIWGIFQISGWIFSSKGVSQQESLARLTEPPARRLADPYRNAYLYLLGFAASPSLDPAKVGYEIWVETDNPANEQAFDYEKPGRSELRIPLSLTQALPSWNTDDPLASFRRKDAPVQSAAGRYQTLLLRYAHCLEMPFEDWGYGRRATPRVADIATIHRVYVAEGFSRSTNLGLGRLYKESVFWRTVLREATTMPMKVAAQVIIQDDISLLSRMLSKPNVDKTILTAGLQLTVPLTQSEYSLRWPIQHQVVLATKGDSARAGHGSGADQPGDQEQEWLAAIAHLPSSAFQHIEHPSSRSLVNFIFPTQATWDVYTTYYDALIKASGTSQNTLPKFREVAVTMRRGLMESLFNPTWFEPEWETFFYQLMETDARLRLTSLQIQLRRPSATAAVPTRLGEAGSQYFDPFTGLPMLWSPTQRKLYSVGKDRLDDGGDPSFDITVPAVVTSTQHQSNTSAVPSTSVKQTARI